MELKREALHCLLAAAKLGWMSLFAAFRQERDVEFFYHLLRFNI